MALVALPVWAQAQQAVVANDGVQAKFEDLNGNILGVFLQPATNQDPRDVQIGILKGASDGDPTVASFYRPAEWKQFVSLFKKAENSGLGSDDDVGVLSVHGLLVDISRSKRGITFTMERGPTDQHQFILDPSQFGQFEKTLTRISKNF